ncbi:unnamed protein product [Aphanomyces euteiches]
MKSIFVVLSVMTAMAVSENATVRTCTQADISSVNAAWTVDLGAKCLSKLGLTLATLPTATSTVLAKADKDDDCLSAMETQDNIIDKIVDASGDCQLASSLSLYDTTFHDEKGYISGWAAALKGLSGIDVTKVDTTLLKATISEDLPDCTQDDFNLVDAAWATDAGASCLQALGVTVGDFSKGTVSADKLATADSNDDCATVLDNQGQVVDYIVDAMGDCKVTENVTLYALSLLKFSDWVNVIKTLQSIDVGAPTSAPPAFQPSRAVGASAGNGSVAAVSNTTNATTPTTTSPKSKATTLFASGLCVSLALVATWMY